MQTAETSPKANWQETHRETRERDRILAITPPRNRPNIYDDIEAFDDFQRVGRPLFICPIEYLPWLPTNEGAD